MIKKPFLPIAAIFLSLFANIVYAYGDDDDYYDDYGGRSYYREADENAYYSGFARDDDNDADDGYYAPRQSRHHKREFDSSQDDNDKYGSVSSRLPQQIASPGEKLIVVDPHVHAWGAYSSNGELLRSGIATAGKRWCPDIDRPCRTAVGSFRIYSLGSFNCVSHKFPVEKGGGAPMPYCMFFNGGQGLHGSYEVVDGNASHGCVRLHVDDAEWLRFNFANIGTKVIVKSY